MGVDLKHSAVDTDLKNKIEALAAMSESDICVSTVNLIPLIMERTKMARSYRIANEDGRKMILESIDYLDNRIMRILNISDPITDIGENRNDTISEIIRIHL